MGIINNFFISGRTVNVKITETSMPLAITYLSDVTVYILQYITNIQSDIFE